MGRLPSEPLMPGGALSTKKSFAPPPQFGYSTHLDILLRTTLGKETGVPPFVGDEKLPREGPRLERKEDR